MRTNTSMYGCELVIMLFLKETSKNTKEIASHNKVCRKRLCDLFRTVFSWRNSDHRTQQRATFHMKGINVRM